MHFVTKSTDDFSEDFLDFVRLDSQLARPRTLAAAGRFKFPANGRHTSSQDTSLAFYFTALRQWTYGR